jgi:crotonobetainyl-CoA:carnitine CoA-transferase CaiB-like acyl-CoA transferase
MQQALPLAGITVLELGTRIGVSTAGSLLAQLGAEVVFIEAAGSSAGKLARRAPFAAGKSSLRVQPGSAGDLALLADLARACDVVIDSPDADPASWRGLSGAAVVPCTITAFGASGPMAGRPCSDAQVQALSGMLDSTGFPDTPPSCIGFPVVEHMAGMYAAGAVIAALRGRRLQGLRQGVEVSLYDVAFAAMSSFLAPAFEGQARDRTRVGNRHTMAAPWNAYRARDGFVLLCAGSDEQWRRICGLLGQPGLLQDPRLRSNAARVAHVDAVDAAIQGWTGSRSVADCVRDFGQAGLPCGPVAPIDGHPREANLEHRRMVREALDPVTGRRVQVPGSAFRMSRTPGRPLLRIPAPDADREQVRRLASRPLARTQAGERRPVLAGVRVIEVGHYTTVPVAARTLAALGAEVIKVEPPGGEAVRGWPPTRNGQGVFFSFQNSGKQSVCLDLETRQGRERLQQLLRSADVLVENLRPGALARKGFGPADLERLNPRLICCSMSGFGVDSLYPGRAAFDMVIQAASGMMDATRCAGLPIKAGPSISDVAGAAFGFAAILAALEQRDACGLGQHLDLSMQDISATLTQTRWNDAGLLEQLPLHEEPGGGYRLGDGADAVAVLRIQDTVRAPQTLERRLWFDLDVDGTPFPMLAVPFHLQATPPVVGQPPPRLGQHTPA